MEPHFIARNNIIDMLQDRHYKTLSGKDDLSSLRVTYDEFKKLYSDGDASEDQEASPSGAYDISGIVDNTGKQVYVLFLKGRMNDKKNQETYFSYLKPAFRRFGADESTSKYKEFIETFTKTYHIIMVYSPPYDKTNREKASSYEKAYKNVEYFHVSRLGFNITKFRHMGNTSHPTSAQPEYTLLRKNTPEWKEIITIYGGIHTDQHQHQDDVVVRAGAGLGAGAGLETDAGLETNHEKFKSAVKRAKSTMIRITKADPMSKWYCAQPDDIFKIVRGRRRLSYRVVF